MVGSYRTEDPATPPATKEWLLRIKGSPVLVSIGLEPLTRAERPSSWSSSATASLQKGPIGYTPGGWAVTRCSPSSWRPS